MVARILRAALGLLILLMGYESFSAGFGVSGRNRFIDPLEKIYGKRYLITFKNAKTSLLDLSEDGLRLVNRLQADKVAVVYLTAAAKIRLADHDNVELIEEDPMRYPMSQRVPYGIPLIGGWDFEEGDGDRTACIIDSGYDRGHEDLPYDGVSGVFDSVSGDPFLDLCSHGTHVAGTIAAMDNDFGVVGLNKNGSLKIHIVKVFDTANCQWAYSSTLIAALEQCQLTNKNIVVNMSLGGDLPSSAEEAAFKAARKAGVLAIAAAGNSGSTDMSFPASYDDVMSVAAVDQNKALAVFSQRNIQVEIAAPGVNVDSTVSYLQENFLEVDGLTLHGLHVENSKTNDTVSGVLAAGGLCQIPGAWDGKVVVCQRGEISFFDKVKNAVEGGALGVVIYNNVEGPLAATLGDGHASFIVAIGLSMKDGEALMAREAFGKSSQLTSTFDQALGGYSQMSGTSMATPHVVGAAALLWGAFPNATNDEIREALTASAEDLGDAGRDDSFGYGLVDLAAARAYLELQ